MQPAIVDFDHLRDFLTAYAEHKRSASKTWTLGAWARKLGIKHKATLSRVLAGQREAGPELLQRFQEYFPFSPHEREYFGLLATLSSKTLGESVEAALRAELARTRRLIVAGPTNDDLLRIDDGILFAIHGFADVDRVNAFLAPQRLVASPLAGKALLSLTVAQYSATNLGPYAEAHFTIFAAPAGGNVTDMGIAFSHQRCTRSHVASLGRLVWGNGYALEEMSLSFDGTRFTAESQLFSGTAEHPLPTEPFHLATWCFPSTLGGRARFTTQIEAKRTQQRLDERIHFTVHSPMKELLDDFGFVAEEFSLINDLRMLTSIPAPIA
jgi:hypothetical protein